MSARLRDAHPPPSATFSLEFAGGGDPAFSQPEDNQPRPSQLLRLQREAEEEPVYQHFTYLPANGNALFLTLNAANQPTGCFS